MTVTRAVNNVLFIVVVLELVRTIVGRLEGGGFQLQPFLITGIISATRNILTVGAELSLVGGQIPLTRTMAELAVNAGVVLALSVALVLVRRLTAAAKAPHSGQGAPRWPGRRGRGAVKLGGWPRGYSHGPRWSAGRAGSTASWPGCIRTRTSS